eukprot:TRINITY_DN11419_c0_g1_i1.p1 TRINITY_DN11419_c0_g1~~TRINITY_DN11419_c0_g1_i1.p1  ORF type:complete len:164 (-),score=33.89 TRINITY_DN11419_c0_g1_i1:72-563(-)
MGETTQTPKPKMLEEPDDWRDILHEKQNLQQCGIHCVNNLLQEKAYGKKDFDEICLELAPDSLFNPHKSILGTGNYDVNVIMNSLFKKDLAVKWFDKRKDLNQVNFNLVIGLIVNYTTALFFGMYKSKHCLQFAHLKKRKMRSRTESQIKSVEVTTKRKQRKK